MKTRQLVLLASAMLLLSMFAFSQGAATGDLHVTVKDLKGAVVTNATVTARDEARAFERSTATNSDGEYRILALPPGKYSVVVEAPGFAKNTSIQTITVGQMADSPYSRIEKKRVVDRSRWAWLPEFYKRKDGRRRAVQPASRMVWKK